MTGQRRAAQVQFANKVERTFATIDYDNGVSWAEDAQRCQAMGVDPNIRAFIVTFAGGIAQLYPLENVVELTLYDLDQVTS